MRRRSRSAYAGFGDDVAQPAPAATTEQVSTVADRTPPYTRQTLSLMGVAAIPWVPVVAGAWLGDRALRENGKLWGALAGGAVSFFAIRHFVVKLGGTIT